jgi:conserved oligomeric Golgi complex subunit 2
VGSLNKSRGAAWNSTYCTGNIPEMAATLYLKSPTRPASSYSAGLHIPSSSSPSSEASQDGDDVALPFPTALPRSDFLTPDFHPANYLSALPHRHQTLEDLRSELRDRSAALSAELLELVNANYTSFLSLGDELHGGEEKVEDVRVAMLGFRRAVEEIKSRVASHGAEVHSLGDELRGVRKDIETGRRMTEIDDRLSSLEDRLAVQNVQSRPESGSNKDFWSIEDSEESEGEEFDEDQSDGLIGTGPARLTAFAQEYIRVDALIDSIGREAPFAIKTEPRMMKCRNTILLDLGTALKEARRVGTKGHGRVVRYLTVYGILGAQADAIEALGAA